MPQLLVGIARVERRKAPLPRSHRVDDHASRASRPRHGSRPRPRRRRRQRVRPTIEARARQNLHVSRHVEAGQEGKLVRGILKGIYYSSFPHF